MNFTAKSILFVLISMSAIYLLSTFQMEDGSEMPFSAETSNKFSDDQLKKIRSVIKKAAHQYSSNYYQMAYYIQGQLNATIDTLWNVQVFNRQDDKVRFISTLSLQENKHYYEAYQPNNFTFSVRIIETNSSNHDSPSPTLTQEPQIIQIENLQFTKIVSANVSSGQEAGIDLAMTTAYTWNKNIKDFTSVAQKLVNTNLNQNWEVLTRFESLDQQHFGSRVAAVYDQWVEYVNYGLGSYVLHVYVFRNYFTG